MYETVRLAQRVLRVAGTCVSCRLEKEIGATCWVARARTARVVVCLWCAEECPRDELDALVSTKLGAVARVVYDRVRRGKKVLARQAVTLA